MILMVAGTLAAILYIAFGLGLLVGFARAARENDRLLEKYEPAGPSGPSPSPDHSASSNGGGVTSTHPMRFSLGTDAGIGTVLPQGPSGRTAALKARCP
jgi:hypothetical protein